MVTVRVRLTAIIILTFFLIGSFPGAPAAGETECVIEEVPGMGPACEIEPGFFEVFDGDGDSLGTTHGPDALPPPGKEPLQPTYSVQPSCVEDPSHGYYTRVIYAWASDRSPTKSDDQIRSLVDQANGILYAEAYYDGGVRTIRSTCELVTGVGLKTIVTRVELPTTLSATTFSTVVADLLDAPGLQGMDDPRIQNWVYFQDRLPACGCSGQGHLARDSSPGPDNWNNGGYPAFAVTFGYEWPTTMIHELGHNMGAVQYDAPHTSGGGHCNDGKDIMCYADGGSDSDYNDNVCSWEQFDCGNDDYFAIDPPPGSYLDRFWNVADMANRFLRGCAETQGRLAFGAGPVELSSPRTYEHDSFGRDCGRKPFILEGQKQDFHIAPLEERGFDYPEKADMDVCFHDGAEVLECFNTIGNVEQGMTPYGTNGATIYAKGGNSVEFFLRIG